MTRLSKNLHRTFLISLCLPLVASDFSSASAESVSLLSSRDNTLYEFDPTDTQSPLNSNGSGDFFSAGRTRSRGLLRRGLLKFDFSTLPDGAVLVPGTAQLTLEVVDSPSRDTSGEARDFWLVPIDEDWGEGASTAIAGVSGAGSGAAASPGDATWLHTSYDPAIHDPRLPDAATDPGYWTSTGVLGNSPVDPTLLGSPAGSVPAAPYLGPVTFLSLAMEADIGHWLSKSAPNFGWLVVGDERIAGDDISSARGFASREHAIPPTLTFEFTVVPEPATLGTLWIGFVAITAAPRFRRRSSHLPFASIRADSRSPTSPI